MNKIAVGNRSIGPGEKIFIIAEAGINHDGDIARAHELVDAAFKANVDCIKFQTHLVDKEMLKIDKAASYSNEAQYQLIRRVQLSKEQHEELKKHAEEKGLIFLSTPFSREASDLLDDIGITAYKIGSGELTNLPLLSHIASKGKTMLISTGMSEYSEVEKTVNFLKSKHIQLGLFQCTSLYPTPPEEAHLKTISRYIKDFDVPVGFSDHSATNYLAFGAVALGISMIEKHFTVSRAWPGPDQKVSLEPDELNDLVKGIRCIEKGMDDIKRPSKEEKGLQELFRESVVTVKKILKGQTISSDMIWVKRPGNGIPSNQMSKIIGKKAVREIKENELIKWADIE